MKEETFFICLALLDKARTTPAGFSPHPFPGCKVPVCWHLAGGTPDEGSPGPKQSTGLISGSPSCVSLRIIPEYACSAYSGEIPRLQSRLEGSAPETPAAF